MIYDITSTELVYCYVEIISKGFTYLLCTKLCQQSPHTPTCMVQATLQSYKYSNNMKVISRWFSMKYVCLYIHVYVHKHVYVNKYLFYILDRSPPSNVKFWIGLHLVTLNYEVLWVDYMLIQCFYRQNKMLSFNWRECNQSTNHCKTNRYAKQLTFIIHNGWLNRNNNYSCVIKYHTNKGKFMILLHVYSNQCALQNC